MNRVLKFVILWYVFILGCLIPLLVIGNSSIHVMYLGWLVFFAAVFLRITWSIAVIVQYGRTGSDKNVDEILEGGLA